MCYDGAQAWPGLAWEEGAVEEGARLKPEEGGPARARDRARAVVYELDVALQGQRGVVMPYDSLEYAAAVAPQPAALAASLLARLAGDGL